MLNYLLTNYYTFLIYSTLPSSSFMCCLNHGILCSIPLLMMSLQPPRFRKPQLTSDVLLTFENQRANCGFHSFQSESHFYEKVLKSVPQLGRDVQTRHQGQRTSCGMRILWPYQLYNRDSSGRGQVSEALRPSLYFILLLAFNIW